MSQVKIKNLQSYKNKNGPFRSLNEVLEVDGLGIKLLEKLCEKIINNDNTTISPKKTVNGNRKLKQLIVPSLPTDLVRK